MPFNSALTRALFITLLIGVLTGGTSVTAQTPPTPLEALRARVQTAGAYRFNAQIEQTLTPRASADTIGKTSERVDLQLEGNVTSPQNATMIMRIP